MPFGCNRTALFAAALINKGVPDRAIEWDSSAVTNNDSVNHTDANFGDLNSKKFTISFWIKATNFNVNDVHVSSGATGAGTNIEFTVNTNSDGTVDFVVSDGSSIYQLDTSGDSLTDGVYNHIMVQWDSANATESERMNMWINGTKQTSFGTTAYPAQNIDMQDKGGTIYIGAERDGSVALAKKIYQMTHFSDALPLITDVYDSGSPKDVTGITGMHSTLDVAGNDITSDGGTPANWTQTGTDIASTTDIPSA